MFVHHRERSTNHARTSVASNDTRCVSDLADVVRDGCARDWRAARLHTHVRAVPEWIPAGERRDWTAAIPTPIPEAIPDVMERRGGGTGDVDEDDDEESPWGNSFRSLAGLYRRPARAPPAVRGSVLEIEPPTLTERFGLSALAAGKRARHEQRANGQRATLAHARERAHAHAVQSGGRPAQRFEARAEPQDGWRKDEYVGFLIDGASQPVHRRRGWFRFFRRSRAYQQV